MNDINIVTIETGEYSELQDAMTRLSVLRRFVEEEDEEAKKDKRTGILYTADIRKIIDMGKDDINV